MTKKELEKKVEELTKRIEELEKRQPIQPVQPFPYYYPMPNTYLIQTTPPCPYCGRTSGCPEHIIC